MLKRFIVAGAVVALLVSAAMSQESDGAGAYTLQSLVREADSGLDPAEESGGVLR
jgi:hypothetical protein